LMNTTTIGTQQVANGVTRNTAADSNKGVDERVPVAVADAAFNQFLMGLDKSELNYMEAGKDMIQIVPDMKFSMGQGGYQSVEVDIDLINDGLPNSAPAFFAGDLPQDTAQPAFAIWDDRADDDDLMISESLLQQFSENTQEDPADPQG